MIHPGYDGLCAPPMVKSTALSSMPVSSCGMPAATVSRQPGVNAATRPAALNSTWPWTPCTVIAQSAWCSCICPPGLKAINTTRIPGCLVIVLAAWSAARYE